MAITMNKELLVRIPSSLYVKVKRVCQDEYKSMSALVRELLLEKVEESLSEKLIKEKLGALHSPDPTEMSVTHPPGIVGCSKRKYSASPSPKVTGLAST